MKGASFSYPGQLGMNCKMSKVILNAFPFYLILQQNEDFECVTIRAEQRIPLNPQYSACPFKVRYQVSKG